MGVFLSEWRENEEILGRLKAEKIGVFLVENAVYHAVIKSPLIEKQNRDYYVLTEDLQTRGFTACDVDNINVVTYDNLVDLMMNDYEKLIWL